MDIGPLGTLILLELWGFLLALFGLVGYQLVTRAIHLDGLFSDGQGRFSPGRVQLLVVSIGAAFAYLIEASAAPELPPVSHELLLLLGGSSSIYLGGKSVPAAASRVLNTFTRTGSSERGDQ